MAKPTAQDTAPLPLSFDETAFHRKLIFATEDDHLTAAWIDVHHEQRQGSIALRRIDLTSAWALPQDPGRSIDAAPYQPGQLALAPVEGRMELFWCGYRDKRGTILRSDLTGTTAVLEPLSGQDCGEFALATDAGGQVYLAAQRWHEKRTDLTLLCSADGQNWQEVALTQNDCFAAEPVLTALPGGMVLTWEVYDGTAHHLRSCLLGQGEPRPIAPPDVPGHDITQPVVLCDTTGQAVLACCVERLVETAGGMASFHSRLMTFALDRDAMRWDVLGESAIDRNMNPRISGYASTRRRPQLLADASGGAWLFFEEQLDELDLDGVREPGRLIARRADGLEERIVLNGHRQYVVAPCTLADGSLLVAECTQPTFLQKEPTPLLLHRTASPQAELPPRPALPDNALCESFALAPLPPAPDEHDGYRLLFGDPHVHSTFSADLEGRPHELYHFARDRAGLDFMAMTDNDWGGFGCPFTPDEWQQTRRQVTFYTHPGRFTALMGFEYTSLIGGQDHRNILTADDDLPMPCWFDTDTLETGDILGAFENLPVVVHLHHAPNRDITHPDLERNVEVACSWRSHLSDSPQFAEYLQNLLQRHAIGFIGAGDNHERTPGLGGGLTGLWARDNTPAAIIEALRARRCFATTGLRPALLLTVSGAWMGSEITSAHPPQIHLDVSCRKPIEQVTLLRNGQAIHQARPGQTHIQLDHTDTDCPPGRAVYTAHILFAGTQQHMPFNQATAYGVHAWPSPVIVQYAP